MPRMNDNRLDLEGKRVALLGAGNTGSHMAPLLAQTPEVALLQIVDQDVYEENNLGCQSFSRSALGKGKAQVQARRAKQINPSLAVEAVKSPVENVPLGRLQVDLIACCLDSRVSRQYVNQVAWRLGIPWVDVAVDGPTRTARVGIYQPSESAACLECRWDQSDYAALEQRYLCQPGELPVAATGAPSSLGSVAASIAAIECQKLLAEQTEHALIGREVLIDLKHHTHYLSSWRRNPKCLFDHVTWEIDSIVDSPKEITLANLRSRVAGDSRGERIAVGMEGHRFSSRLYCGQCGDAGPKRLSLTRRIGAARQICGACGGRMAPRGFELTDWLELQTMSPSQLRRNLSRLGFQTRDVITIRTVDRDYHFQLGRTVSASSRAKQSRVDRTVVV